MRRAPTRGAARALLACLAGVAAALALAACGSSNSDKLIPTADSGSLQQDFETVALTAESGNCKNTEAALRKTEQDFAALPATIDAGLRDRMHEGIVKLHEDALSQCAQTATASSTSTTKTSTRPTSPTKTQTTTTQTTPPTTSTPTNTETTTPPTTSTPSTGGAGGTRPPEEETPGASPGGGTGAGEEEGAGVGGANGRGPNGEGPPGQGGAPGEGR